MNLHNKKSKNDLTYYKLTKNEDKRYVLSEEKAELIEDAAKEFSRVFNIQFKALKTVNE